MQTSVIIVSFNTRATLLRCLETVVGTAPICVVDNASTDGTAASVRERFPQVQLIELPSNQGFSVAVNAGARAVGGNCLLLLNPDTEVPPGGVARMERLLMRRPQAAAVGFRQVNATGAFQLAAGPYPNLLNEALRRVVQRRLDADHPWMGRLMDRLLSKPRPVAWVAGSSLLVRRADFDRVGGFDEGFFLYFEDIDFCLRLQTQVGACVLRSFGDHCAPPGCERRDGSRFCAACVPQEPAALLGKASRPMDAPYGGMGAAGAREGRMRRVLHVMASGAHGGGARHLLGLLPLLQARDLAVSALVGDDGPLAEQLMAQDVPARTLPLLGARWDRRWLTWLEAELDRTQPDLIHYHGTRAGFWGGCLRMVRAAQRSIYTAHGLASRASRRVWSRRLFGFAETMACRADAVISVSRADLQLLVASHGLRASRGHHIPNAVEESPRSAQDEHKARRRLGLPLDVPLVGCVARLAPQKAVGDLLDAVQQVAQAHVVIMGDGPQRQALSQHPLVAMGRAHLVGTRDDVIGCLPACDVFALTSRWEGEPIALLEAMACGLPCVATRTSGASELLRDDDTGCLVDIGAKDQLRAALQRLLSDAPARKRLGANARVFARERSYPRMCAQTMAVYAKVLGDADLQLAAQDHLRPRARTSRASHR